MAKLFNQGKFTFIGELKFGKEPVSTRKLSDTSKWNRTKLSVGVKNDANMQFLNMEYIHNNSVTTTKILGLDNETFEINLSDTNKAENIDLAADFVKTTVDIETDFEKKKEYVKLIFRKMNHEMKNDDEKTQEDLDKIAEYNKQIKEMATNRSSFIHMKDVIKFLNEKVSFFEGKKVRVTGNVKSNFYNGKNNLQYIPSLIEIVEDDVENQLKVNLDLFFDKDSIEDDEKLKKMFVAGYIGERIKKVDKLYPLTVVLDYTKVDENIEQHKLLLDFMKGYFKVTDKKQVHQIGLEINVINGAEVKEFTEDDLTDQQKMQVKLGMSKVEDFRPRGNVYGDKVQELKVVKADLKNFPNGAKHVFPIGDLSLYMASDDSDKKLSDVTEDKQTKQEESAASSDDLMKQLFGN